LHVAAPAPTAAATPPRVRSTSRRLMSDVASAPRLSGRLSALMGPPWISSHQHRQTILRRGRTRYRRVAAQLSVTTYWSVTLAESDTGIRKRSPFRVTLNPVIAPRPDSLLTTGNSRDGVPGAGCS